MEQPDKCITHLDLSTGIKSLILMYKEPENEFRITSCGNNYAKWIKRFGDEFDIIISLKHFMNLGNNKFLCKDTKTVEIRPCLYFAVDKS